MRSPACATSCVWSLRACERISSFIRAIEWAIGGFARMAAGVWLEQKTMGVFSRNNKQIKHMATEIKHGIASRFFLC